MLERLRELAESWHVRLETGAHGIWDLWLTYDPTEESLLYTGLDVAEVVRRGWAGEPADRKEVL